MSNVPETKNAEWASPELIKLGQLKDVAPGPAGVTEGGSGKS
jgi:hypothetical protein